MFERISHPERLAVHVAQHSLPPSPNRRASQALRDAALLLVGMTIAVLLFEAFR